MSGNRIAIIGIGDDGTKGLSAKCLELVRSADVLAGGERHLSFFPEFRGEQIVVKSGLAEMVSNLGRLREDKHVVLLASGDPTFYGIAGFAAKKLGSDAVEIHPNLSSLQLAFARMGESWQDALLESVHGRPLQGLAQRIDGKSKVALLTDDKNTPAAIAAYLIQFGMLEYEAFVAENLGSDQERFGFYTLEAMADEVFSTLNIVILRHRDGIQYQARSGFGFEDEEFHQRKPEKGLITKKEVRVLSLSELKLNPHSVVWDIGAGSGSVSVECTKLAPFGQVFAIEKNEGDLENVVQNRIKFRTDFTILHGKAPEGLDTWPDPNAIFIGGSGGELRELIRICCERLQPDGRIVINAATIETLSESTRALKEEGFEFRVTLVQVSRSKPILDMTRFEGLNPIYIITGYKNASKPAVKGE
ncbi:precorrin-6Y C5,15-methyltransferase [Paenibacillus baekrokdamisoli]|uniref:Precorrin-6Y C5,15-methyltransferase n=1 Tax=Paenibacillus baekrokdamisoli TaxID=1712516 RepID=A0A3G9J6M2_9BACL|nr:precorrin-6y C5,15-methyltransferase (decarboxylating) subunit CbiE [Paenibacillus baekrokdamisoli]MBB3072423.1 precorrin-6Y C5,15-methyltransferase (decarboxylating) [Paenibacillus baekrokdamisoli]BBH20483.1 precorrin-6Y C5,15-methyltransferase [Paenibacillus baekrokdamisoli]